MFYNFLIPVVLSYQLINLLASSAFDREDTMVSSVPLAYPTKYTCNVLSKKNYTLGVLFYALWISDKAIATA